MRIMKRLLTIVVVISFFGCSSTNVRHGKDLASTGVAYTNATSSLVDVAIDSMIDADSEALIRVKLPEDAINDEVRSKLGERLDTLNKGLISNAKSFIFIKSSLASVESYFMALQELSENPQSDATATAVENLSNKVNSLNEALKKGDEKIKPIISDSKKSALSGLSKLVADQVHGAKVGAALKRDAPIIGEALLLQEEVIGIAETIISGALNDESNRFLVDKINGPFIRQSINEDWRDNRKIYIKSKALGETASEIKAARNAAKQMSLVWGKILSGSSDVSEMRGQIEEVDALVAALVALKEAKDKEAKDK